MHPVRKSHRCATPAGPGDPAEQRPLIPGPAWQNCGMTRYALLAASFAAIACAADWPEYRGAGRTGVWKERFSLEGFPPSGLRIRWRTPIRAGFAGPSVWRGRVFVTDFLAGERFRGTERALALDEKSGRVLWTQEWAADYGGLARAYAIGPRATPTADEDRVYVLGAKGALLCLDTATGAVRWRRDYVRDYGAHVPVWGSVSAPIVHRDKLIAVVGGSDRARVVAFDKKTGQERWRSLDSDSEPGYAPPVILEAGGRKQLIVWHASALVSLDPDTGDVFWQQPFNARMGLAVATPVRSGPWLFISSFYNGPMMMELDLLRPKAAMLWKGNSESEIQTDGLHALINTPVVDGDYVYGICSYGQLRCLNRKTGERVWESLDATREKARWATGFLVKHGGHYLLNNDRGELILCRLTPQGYQEIARTPLIKPTSTGGIGRRELGAVNWSHPAYANGHVVARNDEEILSAALKP